MYVGGFGPQAFIPNEKTFIRVAGRKVLRDPGRDVLCGVDDSEMSVSVSESGVGGPRDAVRHISLEIATATRTALTSATSAANHLLRPTPVSYRHVQQELNDPPS